MDQVVSFPGLGIGDFTIHRVAVTLFGFPIYWYGVIIAAAFLTAVAYIIWRAGAFGLDSDRVLDVVLGGVVGGIIGARIYYVIFSWDQYKDNLWNIFNTREGGLAIYGGVIGGFLIGFLMCRLRRVKFLPMADLAVGGLILGQAIGRWGNFVNVEAFGSNTTLPWGMAGPSIAEYLSRHQASLAAAGVLVDPAMPVHPTFFYESMWCLLGFLLIALLTKRRRFDGEITLVYAAWYGLGRAVIEGLRTDSLMWGGIRVSQALALFLIVAAMAVLIYIRSSIKKSSDPDFMRLYVNTEEARSILSGQFYRRGKSKKAQTEELLEPELQEKEIEPDHGAFEEVSETETTIVGEENDNESNAD